MRVVCIGGGPAGLYFAILMKRADPTHEVVVFERNSRGWTNGWGVVFWDDLLGDLERTDPETAHRVRAGAYRWRGQNLVMDGEVVNHEGGGCGIARSKLLDILIRRATELGVDIQFGREVPSDGDFPDADLIVASDGVNSAVRGAQAAGFGTRTALGQNKYVWLGTDRVFDSFTFAFEQTSAGWIWCHAYAFDATTSTFIIECAPETWQGLGLDRMPAGDSLMMLEEIFRRPLDGCRLMTSDADGAELPWLSFRHLTNQQWSVGKTVLMGDAAHTTHFSIGSGTRLALEDSIALADSLLRTTDLRTAFTAYERSRKSALKAAQSNARLSASWFEHVDRYAELPAEAFFGVLRARRDPVLPHISPQLYHRLYSTVERVPALRRAKQRLGPGVRTLYGRVARSAG
jgi:2-polyprenyl-6-methoxyphenol hydroxylase-like FAD-dependent oxidoreductase